MILLFLYLDPDHVRGISYDLWTDKLLTSHDSIWKLDPIFQTEPNSSHALPSFRVKLRVANHLCIKLFAYLMVSIMGS